MFTMLKWLTAPAVLAGALFFAAPKASDAQVRVYAGVGPYYGAPYYGGYYGRPAYRPYYGPRYYSYRPYYRPYYAAPAPYVARPYYGGYYWR